MRKIIAAVFIFITLLSYAQASSNPFSKGDEGFSNSTSKGMEMDSKPEEYINQNETVTANNDPGNPGDVVPIDDYIPLLLLIAAGLIIYKTYGRKSLS